MADDIKSEDENEIENEEKVEKIRMMFRNLT